ncbi:MAG: dihydrodipicolinate synthase family protein [Verrucomicrobiales bacterium]|nr:dihydrodipicolinate synthase family protein [Verrucomicrobiales bacterium]
MKVRAPLTGLIAAPHTPLKAEGSLNLDAVEPLAAHLLCNGITGVFVAGTTGEGHLLTVDERMNLARRWKAVLQGTTMKLIVHVGHNCLEDARTLAAAAESAGADAIGALAPSYFRPATVPDLVDCCAAIAAAAPSTPFYYYDIPTWTGVTLPADDFLAQAAERIPTLAGIKYTNPDMARFQRCLRHAGGRFNILHGTDEALLAGLALGARGAVGSTYNFAAPIYHRLMQAFAGGDLETARAEQERSVRLVQTIARYGYMAAAKAVMGMVGVECGPVRLPLRALDPAQAKTLREDLERVGFFDWIQLVRPE